MAIKTKRAKKNVVIIGAGPSGLGTAYEIFKHTKDVNITLIDRNEQVGGLARSHAHNGHYFDVGPHRFFTKNLEVLSLWKELLGNQFVEVSRLTRILYKNKFFNYPVEVKDVVRNLGLATSLHALLSFLHAKIFLRKMVPKSFEQWIVKNFGEKLYIIFFKTYTEKVWGIECHRIGAEWAAQRIKNLNFTEVVKGAIFGSRFRKAKSLVDSFHYPLKGAGQMYEKLAKEVTNSGGKIILEASVKKVVKRGKSIVSVEYETHGKTKKIEVDFLFSSMPLTHFIQALGKSVPQEVIAANKKLYYREHITVNLQVKRKNIFPDNWIYVHSPEVIMARIANYNNFLPKHEEKKRKGTAISVEYFLFQSDKLWSLPDKDLINFAVKELETISLLTKKDITDGFVIRETESYPTYYTGHKRHFNAIKNYVKSFKNLELIGRGGMYKYNNMDHALYSGLLAARNFIAGRRKYNVWDVNEDAEYLEEVK